MIEGIGIMLAMLGRHAEAADTFTQLIAIQQVADDVQRESIPEPIANLGWNRFHQRRFPEAVALLREALGKYEKIRSDTWERFNTESMLGAALAAAGQFDEAETVLLNSFDKLGPNQPRRPRPGPASAFTGESRRGERILDLYTRWGKTWKVEEWHRRLTVDKLDVETLIE